MFMNNDWIHSGTTSGAIIYQSSPGKLVNRQTSGGSAETGVWRMALTLPVNFMSFPEDAIQIDVRKSASVTAMTLLLEGNDGTHDPAIDSVDIEPVGSIDWEVMKLTPSGVYHPGDMITISQENNLQADRTVFINAFKIKYNSK